MSDTGPSSLLRLTERSRLPRPRFGRLAHDLFGISNDELASCFEIQLQSGDWLGRILQNRVLLDRQQVQQILRTQARWIVAAIDATSNSVWTFPIRTQLSLCLMAGNEEGIINDILDGACAVLPEFVEEFEVVIADDGTCNERAANLARYAEAEPRLQVVTDPKRTGPRGAWNGVLQAARGRHICCVDSDGQSNLLDIAYVLRALMDYDVVFGFRRCAAASPTRRIGAWARRAFMNRAARVHVDNANSAFKLIRREAVQSLLLSNHKKSISDEILAQCTRGNLKFTQVPLERQSRFPRVASKGIGRALLTGTTQCAAPVLKSFGRPKSAGQSKNEALGRSKAIGDEQEQLELPLTICMLAACPFPANYGTPGSIREMAEAVAERGHEVHIVTYHFGENIPVRGVHLHRVRALTRQSSTVAGPTIQKLFLYDFQMIFKTLEVVRRYRPDVLHAHAYEGSLAAWVCRLLTGVPVLQSGHHTMLDELPQFLRPRWLGRILGSLFDSIVPRLADRRIPHSLNMQEFFRQRRLLDRSEPVINFGINFDDVRSGDGSSVRARYGLGDRPVVLYAGLFDEFQRLDLLLEALRFVVQSLPTVRLLLVANVKNPGLEANLQREIEQLGLTDHVVITEPQPLDALPDILAACDVAVVPRPQIPGFPIKLVNYLTARRASVLFASSGGALEHGRHAFLVSPETGKALGEGIVEVLMDEPLRERLARNGYQYVRANHDRRGMAEQLYHAYLRTILAADEPTLQTAEEDSISVHESAPTEIHSVNDQFPDWTAPRFDGPVDLVPRSKKTADPNSESPASRFFEPNNSSREVANRQTPPTTG